MIEDDILQNSKYLDHCEIPKYLESLLYLSFLICTKYFFSAVHEYKLRIATNFVKNYKRTNKCGNLNRENTK